MTAVLSLGPGPTELARQILDHQAPSYTFSFTPFLTQTYRHGLSPNRPVCKAYQQGHCPLGVACPDKHINSNSHYNNLVCKHWLRGLCKKGDSCEFLHEYNLRRMPECQFFRENGFCLNKEECLYLHHDSYEKNNTLMPCPHYDKGYCPLGPRCSKRHVRQELCEFYLAGFCPEGKTCAKAHPRWPRDLAKPTERIERSAADVAAEQDRLREKWEAEQADKDRDGGGRFGAGDRGRGRWGRRGMSGAAASGTAGGGRGRGRRDY